MSDMNIVALMGRITRDAELRTTASGKSFVRFSIAVNRTRKQGEQYISVPSFFTLSHFGKAAESVFPYLKKGQLVTLEAHLEQRTWEQQGEKRSNTEIVIDRLHLAGWRKEDAGGSFPNQFVPDDAPESVPQDYCENPLDYNDPSIF